MNDFVYQLKTRLLKPLPGTTAQNQMRARQSGGEAFNFHHQGPPRQGGVALLLYQHHGSWYFPLMRRKEYPGVHSGQISFPGGKLEPADPSLIGTAIRETREELGLQLSEDQVIGNLSELYIIASHFNILPVVAVMQGQPVFAPDAREVDQVIIGSMDQLLQPETRKEKKIEVRGYHIMAPYFEIDNQVVWGATAMILNEFLAVVREIVHA